MKKIILTTINAKWIHPSLALRLLKANLGPLEETCQIMEFALRQPLSEKTAPLLAAFASGDRPQILGISVSIWNHTATIELLEELEKSWSNTQVQKPIIVLGGPEVSHLSPEANIFKYADYIICGEGETPFRLLCEDILAGKNNILRVGAENPARPQYFIYNFSEDLNTTKTAYHLYTNEDLAKKLIYVESSRGCPFSCDFCLSAIFSDNHKLSENSDCKNLWSIKTDSKVREFPLEQFLTEMDKLVKRGVKTFKFLDRTFNSNITRAIQICEFFLEKIEERKKTGQDIPLVVHFEMVPSLFSSGLNEVLTRFPPGTLRLEIGFQTLNTKVAARIRVPSKPAKDLETLRLLCEKTNAIIHADLIAGLPGENLKSFGRGFDRLWQALSAGHNIEIQVGILKQLPGAPISRHNDDWGMRYAPLPPYEVEETSVLSTGDLQRIKNFARFWELIVNRGLIKFAKKESIFDEFMAFSGILFAHFGRNWGIDRNELLKFILDGNSLISLKLLQTF